MASPYPTPESYGQTYGQPAGQTYPAPESYGQTYGQPSGQMYMQASTPQPYGGYSAYNSGYSAQPAYSGVPTATSYAAGPTTSYSAGPTTSYSAAPATYSQAPASYPTAAASYPTTSYAAPADPYTYSGPTMAAPQYSTSYSEAPRQGSFTSYPAPTAGSFTYSAPADPYGGAGMSSYPTTSSYQPAPAYPSYGGQPSYSYGGQTSYPSPLLQPPVPTTGSFVASAPQFQFYPETGGYPGQPTPGYSPSPPSQPVQTLPPATGPEHNTAKPIADTAPPTHKPSNKPGGKPPTVTKKKGKKMCCC